MREIEPGELLLLNDDGVTSYRPFVPVSPAMCVFEYVYFSRPDSKIFGANAVYGTRKALGRQLAKESPVPADIVIPVPDSGVPAALGYAEGAGIPFELGLIRNHYVGRTFIEPEQSIRHFGVKVKLNAVPEVLEGKRVVVVDDFAGTGYDKPENCEDASQCRSQRSAYANQFAADYLSLFLWYRYAYQEGTYRFQPHDRRDSEIHYSR